MHWLFSSGPDDSAQLFAPPCLSQVRVPSHLSDTCGMVITTDSLEHIRCALDWKQRHTRKSSPLTAARPASPVEDSIVFDEVGDGGIDLTTRKSKESVLLVVISSNHPFGGDLFEDFQKELRPSIIQVAKSRYPACLLADLIRTVQNISQWLQLRPTGTVVFTSDNSASKQLLLYIATTLWLDKHVEFEMLGEELSKVSQSDQAANASRYSFISRPAHPPAILSMSSLFPSQLRTLHWWKAWLNCDGARRTAAPAAVALSRIGLNVAAKDGKLLETFGDEHPTLELWRGSEQVLSSRPSLTMKHLEPAANVAVQSLELSNSVIRRHERVSLNWDCDLDSVPSFDGDFLLRIFTAKAMLRIQLHVAFFAQADSRSFSLPFENAEIDGYDLCGSGDSLKIQLGIELAEAVDHPSLVGLLKQRPS